MGNQFRKFPNPSLNKRSSLFSLNWFENRILCAANLRDKPLITKYILSPPFKYLYLIVMQGIIMYIFNNMRKVMKIN